MSGCNNSEGHTALQKSLSDSCYLAIWLVQSSAPNVQCLLKTSELWGNYCYICFTSTNICFTERKLKPQEAICLRSRSYQVTQKSFGPSLADSRAPRKGGGLHRLPEVSHAEKNKSNNGEVLRRSLMPLFWIASWKRDVQKPHKSPGPPFVFTV